MKVLIILFGLLAFSAAAVPRQNAVTPFFVDDVIASIIENVSQQLKDEGYDPYELKRLEVAYALPVPILFDVSTHIADLVVTGVSEIVINNINYGLLSSRLTLDIVMPRISIALGDSALSLTVLGKHLSGAARFNFAITNARIQGVVQMNVGVVTGIFVRSVDLDFSLGSLEFDGSVVVSSYDLTPLIHEFITNLLPNQLNELRSDINELINIIVLEVADRIL